MNPIELVWGWIRFYRNEVAIDSKPEIDDPPGCRLGSFISRVFGKLSGDRLVPNPEDPARPFRKEKVLVQAKEDEDFPGQLGGSLTLHLQRPGTEDDANMIPVLTMTTRYARLHVPLQASMPSLTSSNGRFRCVMQDDGNLVVYDGPRAVWSTWTGPLPRGSSADTGADVPGGGAP